MHDTCARCGSDHLIPEVALWDHFGDFGARADHAEVEVHGAPRAFWSKDTASGNLNLRICGSCGHAELRVTNFRELYEKYKKSRTR